MCHAGCVDLVGAGFGTDVDCPDVGKPALRRWVADVDRQFDVLMAHAVRRQEGGFPNAILIVVRDETRLYGYSMPLRPA
jgi:hypothetical protein